MDARQAGSYDLLALSFERPLTSNRRDSVILLSTGVLFAERLLRRGPTFWFPLYGGCAAAVSAHEVD